MEDATIGDGGELTQLVQRAQNIQIGRCPSITAAAPLYCSMFGSFINSAASMGTLYSLLSEKIFFAGGAVKVIVSFACPCAGNANPNRTELLSKAA